MRVILFCFVILLLHDPEGVYAQSQKNFAFNLQNVTIGQVLEKIQDQSDYRFFYHSQEVPAEKRITMAISGASINQVLNILFNGLGLTWKVLNDDVVIISKGPDKNSAVKISGAIYQESGLPIPGASVYVKGMNAATIANDMGHYEIEVSLPAVLIFTCLGFRTFEWQVDADKKDIVLSQEIRDLDQVIVVGYGTQKKITKTGSVSSVSREEIMSTPSASLQNSLAGKITGLFSQQRSGMPGKDGAEFNIRGASTFTGTISPLVLVDDIEYSYENFSAIDPNEIESVTVLKDASTTAIYGIRGANGVLLVTTRRGKAGSAKIGFRTSYGLQMPTHVPKFLDAYQTALLRNESIANDNAVKGSATKPEFTAEDLALFKSGADPYNHPDVDWYNALFRSSAPISSSNMDISGGTENLRYFISLGYLNQVGMLRHFSAEDDVDNNYYYNRYNFRSNLDVQATRSLSLKLDLSGNYGVRNNPYFDGASGAGEVAAFSEVFNYEFLSPYIYNIYNPDGSYGYSKPSRPAPYGSKPNIIGRIAYGGYTRVSDNTLNLNLSGIQQLDAITTGLTLRGSVAIMSSNSSQRQLVRRNFPSFYYDAVTGTYTPRDANIYRVDKWGTTYAPGSPVYQVNLQGNLSYARMFGKHSINTLLLVNQTTHTYPDRNVNNDYIPSNFQGFTFRGGYNFAEKYMVELSGAYNGTDRFIASKRYGFFPAVSAGWNVAEESFVKEHLSFIDLLKLRASYGLTGSDDPGTGNYYIYEQSYNRTSNYSLGESNNVFTGIAEGSLANNEVTWQKERKLDLGIDIALWKGALSATMEYFDNYRYDILTVPRTVPAYFGLSMIPPVNIGRVSNKGYEAELNCYTFIGSAKLSLKGTYSHAKNKILQIDEVYPQYPWQKQTGQSLGVVLQYIFDGFYTQQEIEDPAVAKPIGNVGAGYLKYRDLNGDGKIDVNDQAYTGNPNLPTDRIGLNIGFSYKNLSISALLQSDINFDFQLGQTLSSPWKANLVPFELKRWTPETAATAKFPRLTADFVGSYMDSNVASTFWSIPGNYIRLKSAEISYNLSLGWLKKMKIQSARIYANGYNLITLSRSLERFQLDPEVARGSSDAGYPQGKIYNIGVALQF